jgi:hypothetical protein
MILELVKRRERLKEERVIDKFRTFQTKVQHIKARMEIANEIGRDEWSQIEDSDYEV